MISVIIPTFNREDDLKDCIISLIKNSFFNNEIIVLTPKISDKLQEICNYPFVKVINDNSRVNGKRVKSLWQIINYGIELASYDYVCWLNDDCLVNKDWDKIAVNYFFQKVGLVVLKSKGICGVQEYRVAKTNFGIPLANYGILNKKLGIKFDERFSWYQADDDISLQVIKGSFEVVGTTENLIIHNHKEDENRTLNDSDPRVMQDRHKFNQKWLNYKYENGNLKKISRFHGSLKYIVFSIQTLIRIIKDKIKAR